MFVGGQGVTGASLQGRVHAGPSLCPLGRPQCDLENRQGQACSPPSLQRSLGAACLRLSLDLCWQELEAIRLKLWAMEQAQGPEPQAQQQEEEDAGALLAGQLPSPEAGRSQRARPGPSLGGWPQRLEHAALSPFPCNVGSATSSCRKRRGFPQVGPGRGSF